MKSVSYDDEKKWERLQRMRKASKKKSVRDKVDEEVGISSAEKMADARKEAQLRRKEDLAKNAKKKKQQSDKQKARERKGSISASKTLTSAQLKKYDTDGDGKVRVVNASYDPVNEGADQKRTTKGRWVDDQGRSHNFSVSTRTGDHGYITQFIKSKFPAKQVIVTGQSKETPPKKAVKEDRAFDNVVASLRAKHGKDAVITKDSPKPKPQPRQKPKPDTRTDAQKKADQHTANMDAVYGGKQRDRGLGT